MGATRTVAAGLVVCAALLLLAAGGPNGSAGQGEALLAGSARRSAAQRLLQKHLYLHSGLAKSELQADPDDKIKVYDASAARKAAADSSPMSRIFGLGPFGEVRSLGARAPAPRMRRGCCVQRQRGLQRLALPLTTE
jgi:hypothetical protein